MGSGPLSKTMPCSADISSGQAEFRPGWISLPPAPASCSYPLPRAYSIVAVNRPGALHSDQLFQPLSVLGSAQVIS